MIHMAALQILKWVNVSFSIRIPPVRIFKKQLLRDMPAIHMVPRHI